MINPHKWGSSLVASRRRWVLRDKNTGQYFAEPHGPELREWTPFIWLAYQFVTYERASSGAKVFWALHSIPLSIDEYRTDRSQEFSGHD